jgi:hypothetical protein
METAKSQHRDLRLEQELLFKEHPSSVGAREKKNSPEKPKSQQTFNPLMMFSANTCKLCSSVPSVPQYYASNYEVMPSMPPVQLQVAMHPYNPQSSFPQ